MKISIIAAIDRHTRTIGKEGGGIPWKISEDFKHFRETTMGHPIIMGRTTWEEFKGKPLPGREHIIVTRNRDYTAEINSTEIDPELKSASQKDAAQAEGVAEKVFVVHDLEFAIKLAKDLEMAKNQGDNSQASQAEIFIIGGAQIYEAALPFCDRLYLTLVDANIDGPKKFPDYESAGFTKIIKSRKSSDENFTYEFLVLEK